MVIRGHEFILSLNPSSLIRTNQLRIMCQVPGPYLSQTPYLAPAHPQFQSTTCPNPTQHRIDARTSVHIFLSVTLTTRTSSTYDHRLKRIGHPPRSAIHKRWTSKFSFRDIGSQNRRIIRWKEAEELECK